MKQTLAAIFAALLAANLAFAQKCEIIGYDHNGVLTFSTANLGGRFTLEFAPNVAGPWTNWGSVSEQSITGSVMVLPTPMFFRILEKPPSAPDVVADTALRLFLITRGFDSNGDFHIDASEAERVPYLVLWGRHNGLPDTIGSSSECGWGWQTLDCSPFTGAQSIFLREFSWLTNVNVSGLSSLTNFACRVTPLQSLDLSGLTALKKLYVEGNQITNLDISLNTNLVAVYATGNPLQQIVVWWDPTNTPPIILTYDGSPTIRKP